jgi:hypothetical protein
MDTIIKDFMELPFNEQFSLVFLLGVGMGFTVSIGMVMYHVIKTTFSTSKIK